MAIKALAGITPEWYTPSGQEKDAVKTRFKIRPLDGGEYAEIMDAVELKNGVVRVTHAGRERALSMALVAWENFSNKDGELKFNQDNMRLIPFAERTDIVTRIINISNLTDEEVKN